MATEQDLPQVRTGVEADIPQIIEMGRMLHAENAMMPLSLQRVEDAARRGIAQDMAMIGIIGDVGKAEAMIGLTVGRFWYTDSFHLEELFAFVRPEFRKSNNAKALIEFAKSSALRIGVPLLIGVISNERTEAKTRLYERRLGKPSGAYFLFNGKTGI